MLNEPFVASCPNAVQTTTPMNTMNEPDTTPVWMKFGSMKQKTKRKNKL